MSRKKEAIFMGIGILAVLALSGPAVQAATEFLTASHTSQTFYVNGQKVEFEAYSIHDNNFVKLRDIAQAVDFSVTYNAATNSVYIDPDAPYQEETLCWDTTTRASRSAPTLMPPGRCRIRRRKPWAASWHK